MARPSLYSPELLAMICERISQGEPLTQICRDKKMPSDNTVRNWAAADPEISAVIARARVDGHEAIAEQCLDIADDARNDWMVTQNGKVLDAEHVQRSKLRIETRLKLLAKWDPKRYGDQLNLNHGGNITLSIAEQIKQAHGERG